MEVGLVEFAAALGVFGQGQLRLDQPRKHLLVFGFDARANALGQQQRLEHRRAAALMSPLF